MSYIDCYSHSDVGSLLGFEIYHPFDKLDEEGYEIDSSNFLFGGGGYNGGGESKSFIFEDIKLCVLLFLKATVIRPLKSNTGIELLISKLNGLIYALENDEYTNFIHNFSISEIIKLANAVYDAPINFVWSKNKNFKHDLLSSSVELRLNIMAGEIFYFYSKDLFPAETLNLFKEIVNEMESLGLYPFRIYDEFKPAVKNWNCGGLIMYKGPNEDEIKTLYGVSYLDEENIKKSYEYQNRIPVCN